MDSSEIFEAASKSRLLKDPYVEKIWSLMNDRSLLRDALSFFSRHSNYYRELFERLGISHRDAELEDVAKLAIPSDILRGEGHKQFLIKDVEENGEYFVSSSTTNPNPVKIYRSPLDLAIMIRGDTYLFEYVYGEELESGKRLALFMAYDKLSRKHFVSCGKDGGQKAVHS